MTRGEADKLQKALDDYVELRDRACSESAKLDSPSRPVASEVDEARATSMKWREKFRKVAPELMRLQLATFIEPMLPEVKIGGSMDLTGFVGAFASVLGIKIERSVVTIPVVDGHEDVDEDDIGWEEYERLYCVRVPGEIMKEALTLRSAKTMFELSVKR